MTIPRRPRGNPTPRQRRLRRRRDEHRLRSSRPPATDSVEPGRLARHLRDNLTEEHRLEIARCVDAEARADVDAAIEHYRAAPYVVGAPQLDDLLLLQGLGDEVPGWAWSRWVSRQAHRWLLFEEDLRVRDAVLMTTAAMWTDITPLGLDDPDELFEHGNRLAASHWVTAQLLLHDYGGLHDFLCEKARPALLRRADEVAEWPAAPMGGYRVVDAHGDAITLRDWADGSTRDVLNLGAATGLLRDATVIGRVVPVGCGPGAMFESRPLEVDPSTALAVARAEGRGWLQCLHDAVVAGSLPEGYGFAAVTPLTSDVDVGGLPDDEAAGEELPGRVGALVEAGVRRDVAEAIATCEVVLIVAEVAPDALAATAPHAALALVHDLVFEAALAHCTAPAHEAGWRAVAGCVAEPARGRCLRLAEACRPTPRVDPAA